MSSVIHFIFPLASPFLTPGLIFLVVLSFFFPLGLTWLLPFMVNDPPLPPSALPPPQSTPRVDPSRFSSPSLFQQAFPPLFFCRSVLMCVLHFNPKKIAVSFFFYLGSSSFKTLSFLSLCSPVTISYWTSHSRVYPYIFPLFSLQRMGPHPFFFFFSDGLFQFHEPSSCSRFLCATSQLCPCSP